MAGVMGLEPTTFAVTGRRCNQLNYTPANKTSSRSSTVGTTGILFCSGCQRGLLEKPWKSSGATRSALPQKRKLPFRVLRSQNRLHLLQDIIINRLEILLLGPL